MCIKQSQTRYLLLEISEEKQGKFKHCIKLQRHMYKIAINLNVVLCTHLLISDIKCCSTPRPMCKEHCQCCSDGEWHSGPMGLGNCEDIELDNSKPCQNKDLNTG
jgi:hypothetical protein